MKWDRIVRNEEDGEPVLSIKYLVYFRGRRIDLHKIHRADLPNQFHSHPARIAIRIILWGGYAEQFYHGPQNRIWRPGMIGIVRNTCIHRISRLLRGPSYSLWIRGRIRFPTILKGRGWPEQLRDTSHRSSEQ